MKISVVGAGSVGATIAYSIASKGLASKLVLVDKITEKAVGEAMDLKHCASFIPPVEVNAGDLDLCKDMDVVVITAGTKRRPGEDRTDLVRRNIGVFRELAGPLAEANPKAVFLIVSNPVDLLTLHMIRHSKLNSMQVIGSGTLLDTSRLRYLLAERFDVDPRNVHAYIIGEHGKGSVPVWSHTQIGVLPVDDFAKQSGVPFGDEEKQAVFERVLSAGQDVIQRKGATFYGIAQTVLRILTAITRDEQSILTVCTDVGGFCGVENMALSVPVVVGRRGAESVLDPQLSVEESRRFKQAAKKLEGIASEVGL
jgi:L-lactate dehydrogenase